MTTQKLTGVPSVYENNENSLVFTLRLAHVLDSLFHQVRPQRMDYRMEQFTCVIIRRAKQTVRRFDR